MHGYYLPNEVESAQAQRCATVPRRRRDRLTHRVVVGSFHRHCWHSHLRLSCSHIRR
jgi:hypothetical protein